MDTPLLRCPGAKGLRGALFLAVLVLTSGSLSADPATSPESAAKASLSLTAVAAVPPLLDRDPGEPLYTPLPDVAAPPPFAVRAPLPTDARAAELEPAFRIVTKGRLKRGETLSAALRKQGVSAAAVHLIAREMRSLFDFRRSRPGDRYRLAQAPDETVLEFRYRDKEFSALRLVRAGDDYTVAREPLHLEARVANLSGVIRTSLYSAIRGAGEQSQLASDFADIFAWDIDFTRSSQPGDDFQILYERLYYIDEDGVETYVRPGQILAAHYGGVAGDFSAVYFDELGNGLGSFFRPDGSAVEKQFLVAPLKYSRISSRYSASRKHPILKVTRPHHGIDYAAPEGTETFSVADGTVIYRGWAGGFGNLVKVRHMNGYVSYYAHLSRFADGLQVGQAVSQKEIIGYVGHTGLATGAHVCFRITKDGGYVNPLQLSSPARDPIAREQLEDFTRVRDQLLSRLQMPTVQLVDEAL